MDIIELYDENGEAVAFNLWDSFGMDNDEYAVVEPVDQPETFLLFKVVKKGEELTFAPVEDKQEFNDARKIYEELIEEQEGD